MRATLGVLILIALITFADWVSSPVQLCEVSVQQHSESNQGDQRSQEYCSTGKIVALWNSIGHFVDRWHDDIAAAATAVIALFTIVLVFVSNRQAKLTRDSVLIAERAFISMERPYIFTIDPIFIRSGVEIFTDFSVANCGRVAGNLIEINGQFFSEEKLPATPPYEKGEIRTIEVTAIPLTMATDKMDPRCNLGRFTSKNLESKYFLGYFRYDGLIAKGHKTWFCYAIREQGSSTGKVTGGPAYNGYE
jgi:hypothetical protein